MAETAASSSTETSVEDAGPCRKKITLTVPAEAVREEIDRAFRDLIRHVTVPGFRQGHLPRKVAEARFGASMLEDVRGTLMEKSFSEALEKHGLVPIGEPNLPVKDLKVEPGRPFRFEVTVEVRPEVKVPDTKGLRVRRPKVQVAEKDVEEAVQDLLLEHAELRPAEDGVCREKDVLVLDVAVLVGETEVARAENLTWRHPVEVVAGIAAPGAGAALLGKKAEEEAVLDVTLPANFKDEAHRGKEGRLRLRVRDVKRFHLPPLDAEFAKRLDFESVDELREEARKAVRRAREADAEKAVDDALLDALLERAPIPLPEGIVQKEIGQILGRIQADMHMQGAGEEQIEERLAGVQGQARERVEREFRVAFLVDAIAGQRSVLVTENEVAEQVAAMAGRYGRSPEEMRAYLEQRNVIPSLRGRLRERKVLDLLRREVAVEG